MQDRSYVCAPQNARPIPPLTERQTRNFWRKVEKSDDCWLWTASTTNAGYGQFGLVRPGERLMMTLAHRLAYTLSVGPIPDGLVIDHLCENKLCVNPAHLEPVTQTVNARRWRENPCRV
jgi:hypothetical protein